MDLICVNMAKSKSIQGALFPVFSHCGRKIGKDDAMDLICVNIAKSKSIQGALFPVNREHFLFVTMVIDGSFG